MSAKRKDLRPTGGPQDGASRVSDPASSVRRPACFRQGDGREGGSPGASPEAGCCGISQRNTFICATESFAGSFLRREKTDRKFLDRDPVPCYGICMRGRRQMRRPAFRTRKKRGARKGAGPGCVSLQGGLHRAAFRGVFCANPVPVVPSPLVPTIPTIPTVPTVPSGSGGLLPRTPCRIPVRPSVPPEGPTPPRLRIGSGSASARLRSDGRPLG